MNRDNINPIIKLDYPDPDIIRVDNTYYMVSTTMYFMPGCEILRSYDLVHWEHATYVYDRLDSTPAQRLEGKENIYGQGMWAASLRYHEGVFYICFVCNDTHKTYIYQSKDITGPWEKYNLKGFYHDNSILFDDGGKIYIVSGNKDIYINELKMIDKASVSSLPNYKELIPDNGISTVLTDIVPDANKQSHLPGAVSVSESERLIVSDSDDVYLGYEGAHFYKINGKYYLFFIHMPKSIGKRTEAVFVSDNPYGPYVGKDVMYDDRGYRGSGVAQGGIVESPSGKWYSILFQDSGAVGRIPVLMPVTWDKSSPFPVFGDNGKIPEEFEIEDLNPGYIYTPLVGSDDFHNSNVNREQEVNNNSQASEYDSFGFKSRWQFNHEPDLSLIKRDTAKGTVTITTDKLCDNLVQARNVLTQRTLFPDCSCSIDVDASNLKDGDYAGLCILESNYCFIGVTKRADKFYLVQGNREITTGGFWGERHDTESFEEKECIELASPRVTLYSLICYAGSIEDDTALFGYRYSSPEAQSPDQSEADPQKFGVINKLQFKLDHFTGARFGLFIYSTKEAGGSASFSNFVY